ncbi:polymerase family [Salpingoeca rosetta]|uniref:Poly [ADP-ribose] polymerase n=1 Tax=Salpingoeca rosetta (strain ATCC 50818 / BSB-021) TaxID=946362 RepID=F2UFI8_SALR5|nr:polymerase family [Salpingoeca rosetta]EGD75556.1 polymerase family [Salpingoeca rosetta]|eukprot:XP_004992013.1 polymerase family [Salpingoeca rosetta]
MADLNKKTVAQLKALCKKQGLETGGRKADLVARLAAADDAADFTEADLKKKTVAQLKDLLDEKGLSTSGRKADLIARLLAGGGDDDDDGDDDKKGSGSNGKRRAARGGQATKKAKQAAAAAADDDADDDGDEESEEEEEEKEEAVVKRKAGSRCAVDKFCPMADRFHVYEDHEGVWDFTGNQTNIGQNNNKFYILQLLESDDKRTYHTWTRWGRVGVPGQNKIMPGTSLAACKASFMKKFKDKTRNDWYDRANFVKVPGKYDMVHIDYGADDEETAKHEEALKKKKKAQAKVKKVESKLAPSVQRLMQLIFDVKKMTQAVVEMKYDVKKMPLGKLRPEQIKAGYESLKTIEDLLKRNAGRRALADASSEFYTRIPHVFGMRVPPVIATTAMLQEKLQLLEALEDIKTAMRLIDQEGPDASEPEEDQHFRQLKCDLTPVEKGTDKFTLINDYLQNTHGSTHRQYTMEIVDAFEVDKDTGYKGGDNKMLLWHGSRISNWAGILSQGLRIAPPEAPVTGYMFGKGVYFADASSKSANYCFTNRSNNTGILLLCEVALGKQEERLSADSYLHQTLPKTKQSTWGKGRVAPDPKDTIVIDGDVKVPKGKLADTGVSNPHGYTLQYNEFIVYNTKQIRFRYLLRCKFNYKY